MELQKNGVEVGIISNSERGGGILSRSKYLCIKQIYICDDSKDKILELYLNDIYLGYGSYGIAAASLNYFNKSLWDLSLDEMAFLAALPKAPNNYHPIKNKKAAITRRNWVIKRLKQEKIITGVQALKSKSSELTTIDRKELKPVEAQYFLEDVRRELIEKYGEEKLYKGGLTVRTSLDPGLQKIADNVLKKGLINYDTRHGWRGPLANINIKDTNLKRDLANISIPEAFPNWKAAVVVFIDNTGANICLLYTSPSPRDS